MPFVVPNSISTVSGLFHISQIELIPYPDTLSILSEEKQVRFGVGCCMLYNALVGLHHLLEKKNAVYCEIENQFESSAYCSPISTKG